MELVNNFSKISEQVQYQITTMVGIRKYTIISGWSICEKNEKNASITNNKKISHTVL